MLDREGGTTIGCPILHVFVRTAAGDDGEGRAQALKKLAMSIEPLSNALAKAGTVG